jgi:DNA-binding phage protein
MEEETMKARNESFKRTSKKSAVPKRRRLASISFDELLLKDLKNPKVAAGYLSEALSANADEDVKVRAFAFFEAFEQVAKAYGVTNVAKEMGVTRDALYKIFRQKNTTTRNLDKALKAVNLRFNVEPIS